MKSIYFLIAAFLLFLTTSLILKDDIGRREINYTVIYSSAYIICILLTYNHKQELSKWLVMILTLYSMAAIPIVLALIQVRPMFAWIYIGMLVCQMTAIVLMFVESRRMKTEV